MKKFIFALSLLFVVQTASAAIPYCNMDSQTRGDKTNIQSVVSNFANRLGCKIGNNCLLSWEDSYGDKFSIAWAEPCELSRYEGNQVDGSTFLCHGSDCGPFGYGGYR